MNRRCLGDGVYVEFDGNGLALTAESPDRETETVYLEPETWAALERYVATGFGGAVKAEKKP